VTLIKEENRTIKKTAHIKLIIMDAFEYNARVEKNIRNNMFRK